MGQAQWVHAAEGVWKRTDSRGRVRWRAQAWVLDEEGNRRQAAATFDSMQAARDWRKKHTGKDGKRVPSRNAKTLQDAYDDLHASFRYAPATATSHDDLWNALRKADRRLVNLKMHAIDRPMFRRALQRINGDTTREKVRQLVGLLYRREEVEPSPAVREHKPRTRADRMEENGDAETMRERSLDDGTVERIIAAMPSKRDKMLVKLLWRAGLRPGEALALTVGQLDPGNPEDPENPVPARLTIDRAVNKGVLGPTKTGRTRRPFLPTYLANELVEYIRTELPGGFIDTDALVFPSNKGTMLDLHNWRQRAWAKAIKQAGVPDANPYDLRHSFCTNAVAAGVDLASVAEAAGHSIEVLARVYVHYNEEAGRKAAVILDRVHAEAVS
jgi:integrase